MNELNKAIDEAKKIIIAGHVRPDGDCIGACVALQRYIKRFYPEKNVCVYIETVPEVFQFMDDKKDIFSNSVPQDKFDLFIALDCSSPDRLGDAQKAFYNAKSTMCIDHHISNILIESPTARSVSIYNIDGRLVRMVQLEGGVNTVDRKSTRLNSSHKVQSRMPSSA